VRAGETDGTGEAVRAAIFGFAVGVAVALVGVAVAFLGVGVAVGLEVAMGVAVMVAVGVGDKIDTFIISELGDGVASRVMRA
jgi:hypothetical protein